MQTTLTIKEAKLKLRPLNMTLRRIDGEFRVNYVGGSESSAYYTNDLHDAFGTAIAMHDWKRKQTETGV